MAKEMYCSSCSMKISNLGGSVRFKCPSCGNFEIVRCPHCRKIAAKYVCANCSFSGPN